MMNQRQASENPSLYALARLVSQIFHPFVIVIPTMIISMYATTGDLVGAIGWSALCVAFVIAPTLLYLYRKLKRKEYTDADVSVRQQRFGIYIFGGICELLCLATLIYFGAPQILIACFIAAILTLVVGAILNTQTKVSVHMAAMGGCTAVLLYVSPVLGVLMVLASILVGWARIYLRQHTLRQVLLGWGIAMVCVILVFAIYAGLGWWNPPNLDSFATFLQESQFILPHCYKFSPFEARCALSAHTVTTP